MSEILDPTRKKLLFRSLHRGTKEADLLLGRFAERHIAGFDDAELAEFEALLGIPDVDLYLWKTGREAVPAEHDSGVMRRFLAFQPARPDQA